MIECIIPTLKVKALAVSLDYYINILGFKKAWSYEKNDYVIAGISRDNFQIYLCEGNQGNVGTWVWIGVEDDTIFDEFIEKGAVVKQKPTNYSWAYEMKIEDPDGHILRIGTGPKRDLPFQD